MGKEKLKDDFCDLFEGNRVLMTWHSIHEIPSSFKTYCHESSPIKLKLKVSIYQCID